MCDGVLSDMSHGWWEGGQARGGICDLTFTTALSTKPYYVSNKILAPALSSTC